MKKLKSTKKKKSPSRENAGTTKGRSISPQQQRWIHFQQFPDAKNTRSHNPEKKLDTEHLSKPWGPFERFQRDKKNANTHKVRKFIKARMRTSRLESFRRVILSLLTLDCMLNNVVSKKKNIFMFNFDICINYLSLHA